MHNVSALVLHQQTTLTIVGSIRLKDTTSSKIIKLLLQSQRSNRMNGKQWLRDAALNEAAARNSCICIIDGRIWTDKIPFTTKQPTFNSLAKRLHMCLSSACGCNTKKKQSLPLWKSIYSNIIQPPYTIEFCVIFRLMQPQFHFVCAFVTMVFFSLCNSQRCWAKRTQQKRKVVKSLHFILLSTHPQATFNI